MRTPLLSHARRSLVFPLRARRLGVRLPPGSLAPRQHLIDTDQRFFLECAGRLGPIWKLTLNGHYTTCVMGHERGARLVAAHDRHLPGFTIDLGGLFTAGALRGMSGEQHQHYRRLFLRAIRATPLAAHQDAVTGDIRSALIALADTTEPIDGRALRAGLRRLATAVMLRFLYGLGSEAPAFHELEAAYRRFGPAAPVYRIEAEHAAAFNVIDGVLRRLILDLRSNPGAPPSFLGDLVASGELDDTALGNLAYMFEPSHFDLYSLWHWIVALLGTHPEVAAAYHAREDGESRRRYAEAIVMESLRMEQSEMLYRRVTADIVFEGFLLPRGTTLRVCIWEGHKDPEAFPRPFSFEPERFIGRTYGVDAYAPFGLGQRRCLGAQLVTGLTTLFVQSLLDPYEIRAASSTVPRRGAYHWEPGLEQSFRIAARAPDAVSAG